ncbi:hypothetical protein DTO063F5_3800 [Paecilomyces variotii]|nr:hypothetical protein DTO063F5_3800 [Paecilomyces variotii]
MFWPSYYQGYQILISFSGYYFIVPQSSLTEIRSVSTTLGCLQPDKRTVELSKNRKEKRLCATKNVKSIQSNIRKNAGTSGFQRRKRTRRKSGQLADPAHEPENDSSRPSRFSEPNSPDLNSSPGNATDTTTPCQNQSESHEQERCTESNEALTEDVTQAAQVLSSRFRSQTSASSDETGMQGHSESDPKHGALVLTESLRSNPMWGHINTLTWTDTLYPDRDVQSQVTSGEASPSTRTDFVSLRGTKRRHLGHRGSRTSLSSIRSKDKGYSDALHAYDSPDLRSSLSCCPKHIGQQTVQAQAQNRITSSTADRSICQSLGEHSSVRRPGSEATLAADLVQQTTPGESRQDTRLISDSSQSPNCSYTCNETENINSPSEPATQSQEVHNLADPNQHSPCPGSDDASNQTYISIGFQFFKQFSGEVGHEIYLDRDFVQTDNRAQPMPQLAATESRRGTYWDQDFGTPPFHNNTLPRTSQTLYWDQDFVQDDNSVQPISQLAATESRREAYWDQDFVQDNSAQLVPQLTPTESHHEAYWDQDYGVIRMPVSEQVNQNTYWDQDYSRTELLGFQ